VGQCTVFSVQKIYGIRKGGIFKTHNKTGDREGRQGVFSLRIRKNLVGGPPKAFLPPSPERLGQKNCL